MQNTKLIQCKNLIFMIALFLEIFTIYIKLTTIPYMVNTEVCLMILKALRYCGYLLVFIKILMDDFIVRQICIIGTLIIILMANILQVDGNAILCLFLFVVGMKDIDFYALCKKTVWWYILAFTLTVICSLLGIIQNWDYTMGGRVRVSLGYTYPSHATSVFFFAVCLLCYVLGQKLQIWQVIFVEILNIWQYSQTDSRAGTILIFIAPIVFYFTKFFKKKPSKSLFYSLICLVYPICALFSLATAYFYRGSGPLSVLNRVLSNRLYLENKALRNYGISVFGKQIKWIGNGGYGHTFTQFEGTYNYVDCSYIRILLDYGVVIFLLVMIGLTLAVGYAIRKNDKYLMWALVFVAVYSIIEPRLIEIGFNPFVLMLVVLIDKASYLKVDEHKVNEGRKKNG